MPRAFLGQKTDRPCDELGRSESGLRKSDRVKPEQYAVFVDSTGSRLGSRCSSDLAC